MRICTERLPLILLAAGVFCVTGVFLAGTFGGFDFTDEGFYYLGFAHPEQVSDSQSSFHFFGGKLFRLLGHNIVAMRMCTLAATLGGTLILWHGMRQFVQRFAPTLLPDQERRQLVKNSLLLSSFLGYTISPAALSYNFQNAFCLLAATGFLLSACAQPRGRQSVDFRTLLTLAAFGALVGLEFFVKFSSSVPLAAAGVAFFFLVSEKSLRQKGALVGLLLTCTAAAVVLYFGWFQSFSRWWSGLQGTLNGLLRGGYATGEVLRYSREIAALYSDTFLDFTPVWIVALPALVLVAVLRRQPRRQGAVAAVAGLWLIAHLLWLINRLNYHAQPGLPFFLGSLWLLMLLALASRVIGPGAGPRGAGGGWRTLLAAGLFFVLPYIGAFGTTNPIHQNCLYQLVPWFVLAALLLAEIDRTWQSAWPSRIGLVLFTTVASLQFYHGYWLQPYRVVGTRFEQTVATPVGFPSTTLRLERTTHTFVMDARQILQDHGFKPGDDLLVFFDLPGFVFAMGGISPGHPWYFYGGEYSLPNNAMRLQSVPPERRRQAFLVRNTANWDEILPWLRKSGLLFPEEYELITPPMVSPLTHATFEIWKPRSRAHDPH